MTDNRDSFEFGGEPLKVTITIRGQHRDYLFHDISKNAAEQLYAPIAAAKGDEAAALIANREMVAASVAAVVTRADGTRITEAEVGEMRATLSNKLALKCMAFLTDGDVEAAGEKAVEAEVEKKD